MIKSRRKRCTALVERQRERERGIMHKELGRKP
jgi:hypothetical protein